MATINQQGNTTNSQDASSGVKRKLENDQIKEGVNNKTDKNANYDNKIPENKVKAEFKFDSGLKIFISKGNLVHQKTSAIVSPSNSQLFHAGGAAKAIADAGGALLDEECRKFIKNCGQLGVTKVMHTTAGDMRPLIQYVIHTVGPQISKIKATNRLKDELPSKMIETFLNCFNHANNVLKISSIALPAISSGVFGVPLDIVGSAMFKAAETFQRDRKENVLEEIHLVNFDDDTVNGVYKAFEVWSRKSSVRISLKSEENNEKSTCTTTSDPAEMKSDQNGDKDTCAICLDDMKSPEKIKCGHEFCKDCLAYYTENCHNKCPICGVIYGAMKGNQPEGTMQVNKRHYHLSGYEGFETLEISYFFNNGIQNETHPNPGTSYYRTVRNAYLPDNEEGREVADMLKEAFDNKLVFTIGRSLTTGRDNSVIWNDIHHKTSLSGGPYGYPDTTYLKRVKEELADKGIFPRNKTGK